MNHAARRSKRPAFRKTPTTSVGANCALNPSYLTKNRSNSFQPPYRMAKLKVEIAPAFSRGFKPVARARQK